MRKPESSPDKLLLFEFLLGVEQTFHRSDFLETDPLEFAHRYKDPWDQEVVALISALLAYGNVKQIRGSLQSIFQKIADHWKSPSDFVRSLGQKTEIKRAEKVLLGCCHRFNTGEDLVRLCILLESVWSRHGSLGALFVSKLSPEDFTIENALNALIDRLRDESGRPHHGPNTRDSFQYLLTSPRDGSACKRWCLLLRWMGRKDELDLGLWQKGSPLLDKTQLPQGLQPKQLVIPLDTHLGKISQILGLLSRKSLDWKAALEVTKKLGQLDPEDPTRFDFSLVRVGILKKGLHHLRDDLGVFPESS